MSTVELEQVSRWFGNVVAVNDVTMRLGAGVTGLLGPNGAGKSTLINMMAGFLAPSAGTVTLDGAPLYRDPEIYREIGLVPEREEMYDAVTGWNFVLANARLHRLPDPEAAAAAGDRHRRDGRRAGPRHPHVLQGHEAADQDGHRARARPDGAAARRAVQRHGPAAAAAPDGAAAPSSATQGRTILFSSHILEEVEQIAGRIEVMVAGRHAASGDFREIRRLMTQRPHQYTIRSSDDRALASAVIAEPSTSGVELVDRRSGRQHRAGAGHRLRRVRPRAARRSRPRHGIRLLEVRPPTSPSRASSPTWWPR